MPILYSIIIVFLLIVFLVLLLSIFIYYDFKLAIFVCVILLASLFVIFFILHIILKEALNRQLTIIEPQADILTT